jgi:S-adenosylmethionine-diacylglycerol 3-amino-3-carboxypropyl transferase
MSRATPTPRELPQGILPARFLKTINYASVNEDWRTEAAALRLRPQDDVLSITGSGDRPLNLLALSPRRVVAIDVNPAQNHLLELKVAAMRQLPYQDYASFLGLVPAPRRQRRQVWKALRSTLPAECREFWDSRVPMLEAGVIYQGRWERFYRRVSALVGLIRAGLVDALFAFDDITAQRDFVCEHWDTPLWRATFAAVCSKVVSRFAFGDPAYYAHAAVPVDKVLYERMRASLMTWLARENFMISLILRGRLSPLDLPPYLSPDGYEPIRSRLDRLEVVTGELLGFLQGTQAGTFSRFSLSDVPSFLTRPGFERLLDGLLSSAPPGARLVLRQFLTRYEVPDRLAPRLFREPELEARLAAEDRAFAYEFIIAEVRERHRSP